MVGRLKNISNFVIIMFLFSFVLDTSCNRQEARLELMTVNGDLIEQAGVGQPFMLHVVVDGADDRTRVLSIDHTESLKPKQVGVHMHNLNGKSTGRYLYKLCANNPGSYLVGPAKIKHKDREIESSTLEIVVCDGHCKTVKKKEGREEDAFMHLSVDKDRAVVGEKIMVTLRCCYRDNVNVQRIAQPEIKEFSVREAVGPRSGQQMVGGSTYKYAEWMWEFYPLETGETVIPAYQADCDVSRRSSMRGVSSLLSLFSDSKRIYSNSIPVFVDQLPSYDKVVDAVGLFHKMTASINPAVVKKGEGMVFAIEIEGEENVDGIPPLKLHNIPDSLRWYDSKSEVLGPSETKGVRKRFEFILQGCSSGEVEIPKQEFTYFDTKKKSYAMLESLPLMVTIIQNTAVVNAQEERKADSTKFENEKSNALHNECFKSCAGPWYPKKDHDPIPWSFFSVLFFIPMAGIVYDVIRHRWQLYIMNNVTYMRKRSFSQARHALYVARQKNNISILYHIFTRLMYEQLDIPAGKLTVDSMEKKFTEMNISPTEIDQWKTFFSRVAGVAFDAVCKDKNSEGSLFQEAAVWIDRLEKVLQK